MRYLILIACLNMLLSCSLAPKYHRPAQEVPPFFKEGSNTWGLAHPESACLDRGPWWQMYEDPILNDLEQQASCANQNIKAAIARCEEARANLTIVRSELFPSLNAMFNANRQRTSKTLTNPFPVPTFNDFVIGAWLAYELDVWGRVRNSVAVAKNLACASATDLASVNLSIHAELANYYFALRGADRAQLVFDNTVCAYQKALTIVLNRYEGEIASAYDVALAQNQLENAKTLAIDNRLKRGNLEHAIAILAGRPPATFSLSVINNWKNHLVTVDPQIPACLLERRPDIAEAERLVMAANASIGVARAAFFPQVHLGSAIGSGSASLARLFDGRSFVWALGSLSSIRGLSGVDIVPLLTQLIFDAGKTQAIVDETKAKYCETVANYRQTVLNAFREVEDSILSIRQLDHENQTQTAAATAAKRAVQQAVYRNIGGLTTYLDTVVVDVIALQSELTLINIQTQRQVASVQLIRALGGGWRPCS